MAKNQCAVSANRIAAFILVTSFCLWGNSNGSLAWQRPTVEREQIEANWFADGNGFWYRVQIEDRRTEFLIIDAQEGQRLPAFDHAKMASQLSELLSQTVRPNRLPIKSIEMSATGTELVIGLDQGGRFTWERASEKLTTIELPANDTPQSFLFLPPRASSDTGGSTDIEIRNQLPTAIEVYWIDRQGEPIQYAEIEPEKSWGIATYEGHVWLLKQGEKSLGCFVATNQQTEFPIDQQVIDDVQRETQQRPRGRNRQRAPQPRGTPPIGNRNRERQPWDVVVRDHNLWLIERNGENGENGKEIQLTEDGTEENSFQRDASRARLVSMQFNREDYPEGTAHGLWAPNRDYLIAFQTNRVAEPRVHYVEADPRNRLQPMLHYYPYAKPGDPIPITIPRLFRLGTDQTFEEISVSHELFANPYSLSFERWNEDGSKAYFYYNQRGHQCLRLLELELASGDVRTIVEETSETFLHYSTGDKSVRRWLPDGSLLWASERSGWNHLYRFDPERAELINAVTQGNWNVRQIESIDNESGTIWFYAVGVQPDQDPYHRHFCRVQFDGTDFKVLTEGDGTHEIQWSPDKRYLIDKFSRVDLPPVHQLRDAETGSLICEIEQAIWTSWGDTPQAPRWLMPERFSAKGRDGETDIWGIVHWPRNFDPTKKYAVIESIYAGPHDHHVPKSFRARYGSQRSMADAGFIVVQIDGMGTAWRSKAFHDVCYRNLRDSGFPDRIKWIEALAEKHPQVDSQRVGVFGGSAGGQNAMAALLWFHDFYSVAAADCGCHDNRMDKIWWNEQWMGELGDGSHYVANSNMENAELLKGHLMLTVGMLDRNVDPATTLQVVNRLMKANKEFVFLPIIDGGHGSGGASYPARQRLRFFQQHLGAPEKINP